MNLTFSKQANATAVLCQLLKNLGVPVSRFTIKNDLENHPEYPSLLAFTDCLDSWNVPNEAYQLHPNEVNTDDFTYPLIAHIKGEGGRFLLIHEINNEQVKYADEKGANQTMAQAEFMMRWGGIVLLAEKHEKSGESGYRQSVIRGWLEDFKFPFLMILILAAMFATINLASVALPYLLLVLIKLSGVSVSALLLLYSINANNPFIQNLCSLGKKNDCNGILKSDAAKITSWLSWSEVGMFYFAGSLLCLILNPASVTLLIWMSVACLPYTFYSIGYQLKQKNWCVLCCGIQALLWAEALVFVWNEPFSRPDFSAFQFFSFTLCFLFPIAIWTVLRPLLLSSGETHPLKQQLKAFKYNTDLFMKLLSNQPRYTIPDDLLPICLGNKDAGNVITMVSNPLCGPCAAAHKTLDTWLNNRDDVQLKIVFTTANHDSDERTKIAKHFLALSISKDQGVAERALNDWYKPANKSYEDWAVHYPVNLDPSLNEAIQKQKDWCELTDISFTPTILVNGYKLQSPYKLEDLQYLLP
ncbi:Thioredoxin [Pedobacter steynii]|uniref:Thioredoxin n=1 Tax=Pedobacter steynii TaxID=430522 RepID=A0A1G9UPU1_9SPHI|nr:cysteine peptidase family C39 domain-containing protein [Pedobacter steynii]NQX40835.1 thioredoxin domain-containing protein [Pedobacter steynii]SDM61874.1 Thioredoxin [Pedobacter steynii]